jgi:tRNA(fMet)-specific endonuclease VapC
MWAGTERMPASRRKGELQQFYQELLDRVPLLAVDLEATRAYAKIRSHLMQIGRPVPENDIWIAAIAIRYDIALVTRDQHFDLIPDLRLERW